MPDVVELYSVYSYTTDYTTIADPTRIPVDTYVVGPAGLRGPQGPAGPTAEDISRVALGSISGHRMVMLDALERASYADASTLEHASRVVGVTIAAAAGGASVTIRTRGELDEPSFSFTAGLPLFLGSAGVLTQTPPSSGFVLIVGFAITATKIFVAIQQPLLR